MKKNLVILGNQFLCEKRMLNIVQRTVIMDEDAIDVYIHNHQLFKDQRAIAIDADIPVKSGYIFTGEAFVDPVNCIKIPIEGDVEEEEFDEKSSNTTPEIIRWLESLMNEIRALKANPNMPRNYAEESRANLIDQMNRINSAGYLYNRFHRPKVFFVKEIGTTLHVYKNASLESEEVDYYYPNDTFILDGMDPTGKFGLLQNGRGYVPINFKEIEILGDVKSIEYFSDLDKYNATLMDGRLVVITRSRNKYPETSMETIFYKEMKGDPIEYTKEEKLRILVDEEYSVKDIAKEFNVNTSTIYKWLKKYGIKRNAN